MFFIRATADKQHCGLIPEPLLVRAGLELASSLGPGNAGVGSEAESWVSFQALSRMDVGPRAEDGFLFAASGIPP